jgi:cation:H+ antiporter
MAVANVIGSNIFNLLGILAAVALVVPQAVHPEILRSDMWWMLGTAFVLFPLLRSGLRITRSEGALLVAIYAVYLGLLIRG